MTDGIEPTGSRRLRAASIIAAASALLAGAAGGVVTAQPAAAQPGWRTCAATIVVSADGSSRTEAYAQKVPKGASCRQYKGDVLKYGGEDLRSKNIDPARLFWSGNRMTGEDLGALVKPRFDLTGYDPLPSMKSGSVYWLHGREVTEIKELDAPSSGTGGS